MQDNTEVLSQTISNKNKQVKLNEIVIASRLIDSSAIVKSDRENIEKLWINLTINRILFIRGKPMSGASTIKYTSQLQKSPIIICIIIQKNSNKSMGCNNNTINLIISN